jgi:RNA polymerase sigma-70 factor (ECF subfamily)
LDEDLTVITAIMRGDHEAINLLVRKYYSFVYFLAHQVVNNAFDAEDITQEVFWSVYRNAQKFRGEAKVKTWIYQITLNIARTKFRKAWHYLNELYNDEVLDEQDQLNIEEEIIDREESSEINAAIDQLITMQKMVLLLFYYEGLSYQEIAKLLQLPLGTIKTHLYRAKKNLALTLSKQSNDREEFL